MRILAQSREPAAAPECVMGVPACHADLGAQRHSSARRGPGKGAHPRSSCPAPAAGASGRARSQADADNAQSALWRALEDPV